MKRLSVLLLSVLAMSLPASAAWVNVTGALAGKSCACGGVYCMMAVPNQDKVIIGICGNLGLFATTDNGTSWQALGASTGWVDPQGIVFDKDNPDIFWECGIHGGAVHKSTNGGTAFTILAGVNGGDGMGVDMSDPLRKTIVVGSHESSGIRKTADGGSTWTDITAGTSGWTNFPVVLSSQIFLVGGANGAGVFRTTNAGSGWTKVSSVSPSWDPLVTSNGTVYFTAGGSTVLRSSDQGATWTAMTKASNTQGGNYAPIEMPDGSIVTLGANSLIQCSDGKTWSTIVNSWPAGVSSLLQSNIAYNSVEKAFYVSFWDCTQTVPAKAIWKYGMSSSGTTVRERLNRSSAISGKNKIVVTNGQRIFASTEMFNLFGRKLQSADKAGIGISIARVR